MHASLSAFNRYYWLYLLLGLLLFMALGRVLSNIELKSDTAVEVTVEWKALQEDKIYLYYLPEQETEYSDQNSIHQATEGKKDFQRLRFSLPDTLALKQLRLDLSSNRKQKEAWLKKVILSYNKAELVLWSDSARHNVFKPNEFMEPRGAAAFRLAARDDVYDPYLFTEDILKEYTTLLGAKRKMPFPYLMAFVMVFSLVAYRILYARESSAMHAFYTFASCAFMILLLLPLLDETFDLDPKKSAEKRELALKPVFTPDSLHNYTRQYEAYYNDHFGFRNLLVSLGAKLKYGLFRSSSIPAKCAVGKEGWLFLDGSFYKVTEDLTRRNLYSATELKAKVKEWEQRKQSLAGDSIPYYKAVWPDKYYIYPEYLPYSMKVLLKDTISRIEQVLQFLQQTRSSLHIIDVRQDLLNGKKHKQVYEKFDSHWNGYGAFIGYTTLMQAIAKDFPALRPHVLSDYEVIPEVSDKGDIAELLNISLPEARPQFYLKQDSSRVTALSTTGFPERTLIFENAAASTSLTALIYRDSFTTALIPFLKPHFKKLVLLWDVPFSQNMVKQVKPDLVIECYATRYFR